MKQIINIFFKTLILSLVLICNSSCKNELGIKKGMSEDELIEILDDNPTYIYVCIFHFFTYKNRNYIVELKNDENYNAIVSKITSFPCVVGSDEDFESLIIEKILDKPESIYVTNIYDVVKKVGIPHSFVDFRCELISEFFYFYSQEGNRHELHFYHSYFTNELTLYQKKVEYL